jgi:ribose-phosphate pyrophosphokinase
MSLSIGAAEMLPEAGGQSSPGRIRSGRLADGRFTALPLSSPAPGRRLLLPTAILQIGNATMPMVYHAPVQGRGRLTLLACDSGRRFAQRVEGTLCKIIEDAGGTLDNGLLRGCEEICFPNGEIKTVIKENIRGDDVYVIQCLDDPFSPRSVNDNLMGLVTMLHAARQSDAASITAVVPQFPYSRQERKKTREAITASVCASLLELAGANRVITLDIHSEASMGFFREATMEDLHASGVIIQYLKDEVRPAPEELVLVAPDVGGADRARHYSNLFGCPLAIVHKARDYSQIGKIESMRLVGDVAGKTVVMPDDMIATGGTLLTACKLLRDHGAKRIILACSLPFFNAGAVNKFDKAHAEGVFDMCIGTDAVFRGEEFCREHPWYHEVSVTDLFARVIFNINQKRSVSALLT